METWINGAKGRDVRRVIEQNFNTLSRHLSSNILALTTQERTTLNSAYLRAGLKVYDITLDKWFLYSGTAWVECPEEYSYEFTNDNWSNGNLILRYETHRIKCPVVQLYFKDNNAYSPVIGGVYVDDDYNIILSSDMPFSGKVVVK